MIGHILKRYASDVVVILMGVAGSGKTVIGRALAAAAGLPFVDADDYHSAANVAKMRTGTPLDDADRAPWLAALHALVARAIDRRESLVLACSALKQRYRQVLAGDLRPVRFVHLTAPEAVLRARLATRPDHFARPNLLESQLATLEPPSPDSALIVDATMQETAIVKHIHRELGL
jgi:gluconokinase